MIGRMLRGRRTGQTVSPVAVTWTAPPLRHERVAAHALAKAKHEIVAAERALARVEPDTPASQLVLYVVSACIMDAVDALRFAQQSAGRAAKAAQGAGPAEAGRVAGR